MNWLLRLLFGTTFGQARDSGWRKLRNQHIRAHPRCAVCETTAKVEAHHIVPVHVDPSLEMDFTNLITLCRPHHFTFGHLCDWRAHNPTVREDAAVWWARILAA